MVNPNAVMATLSCSVFLRLSLIAVLVMSVAAKLDDTSVSKTVPTVGCKRDPGKCGCSQDDGRRIDLNALVVGSHKPSPLFDAHDKDGNTYKLDPCRDFTKGPGACTHVSACQTSTLSGVDYSLGSQDTATFVGGGEPYNLTFNSTNDLLHTRFAVITLVCDDSKSPVLNLTFIMEEKISEHESRYVFKLTSQYACLRGGGGGGLSPGSTMLIIFFVLLLVYIVGGCLFLRFVRGAQGVETIPNYEFWKALPSLSKDGIKFTLNGCKADTTYDRI